MTAGSDPLSEKDFPTQVRVGKRRWGPPEILTALSDPNIPNSSSWWVWRGLFRIPNPGQPSGVMGESRSLVFSLFNLRELRGGGALLLESCSSLPIKVIHGVLTIAGVISLVWIADAFESSEPPSGLLDPVLRTPHFLVFVASSAWPEARSAETDGSEVGVWRGMR